MAGPVKQALGFTPFTGFGAIGGGGFAGMVQNATGVPTSVDPFPNLLKKAGAGDTKPLQSVTPPPSTSNEAKDAAVQAAVSEAARKRMTARGFQATILSQLLPTSPGGTPQRTTPGS